MFDFAVCVLTNLFRIFLLDKFVSAFLGKDENRKTKKIFVCSVFFLINTLLLKLPIIFCGAKACNY